MSFVDGRVIRQRMNRKDARMARELRRRTIDSRTMIEESGNAGVMRPPHPLAGTISATEARHMTVERKPTADLSVCTANTDRKSVKP